MCMGKQESVIHNVDNVGGKPSKNDASLSSSLSSFFLKYQNAIRLTFCASGICFCYWFYGFLQEKILSETSLGPTFVLVTQSVANIAVALIWSFLSSSPTSSTIKENNNNSNSKKSLNHPLLVVTSSTFVLAMMGSNEAMRFVPYPTAVLAKSCKLIPTMLMGWAIERRSYSVQQWTAAILISLGISIFNLTRLKGKSAGNDAVFDDENYWKGMALLFMSLCMDGFLGACQGFLKRKDTQGRDQRPPNATEIMLFMNIYSLLILIPFAIFSGQWESGIRLLAANPKLIQSVLILNVVVGMGQIFIFLTVSWYSPLVCTTVTTTRKFFTILLSVLQFGHRFSSWQWLSIGTVFYGLYLSIFNNTKPTKTQPEMDEKKLLHKVD